METATRMKDWPAGSHVVLEGWATGEGVDLIAIGCEWPQGNLFASFVTRMLGTRSAHVSTKPSGRMTSGSCAPQFQLVPRNLDGRERFGVELLCVTGEIAFPIIKVKSGRA